jgi:hypothetical protein
MAFWYASFLLAASLGLDPVHVRAERKVAHVEGRIRLRARVLDLGGERGERHVPGDVVDGFPERDRQRPRRRGERARSEDALRLSVDDHDRGGIGDPRSRYVAAHQEMHVERLGDVLERRVTRDRIVDAASCRPCAPSWYAAPGWHAARR